MPSLETEELLREARQVQPNSDGVALRYNISARCPPVTHFDASSCSLALQLHHPAVEGRPTCHTTKLTEICGDSDIPVAKLASRSIEGAVVAKTTLHTMFNVSEADRNTTSADAVRSCLAECLAELECVGFVLRDWLCVTKSSVLGVVVDPSATSYLLAYTPPLPAVPRPLQPSYLAIIAAPHRNVLLPAAALGASPQNSTPVHPTRWPVAIELRDSGGRATLFGSHFGSCFRLSLACSLSVASGDSDNASLCANEPASPLWFADVAVPLDVVSLRVEQAGPGSLPYSLSGHQLEHSFRLLCDGEQRLVVTRRYVVTLPATNFAAARIAASAWPLSSPRCTGIRLSAQQCCFPFLRVSLEHRQGQRTFNSSDVELEGAWVVAAVVSPVDTPQCAHLSGGALAHIHNGVAVFSHLIFEFGLNDVDDGLRSSSAALDLARTRRHASCANSSAGQPWRSSSGCRLVILFQFERERPSQRKWVALLSLDVADITAYCEKHSNTALAGELHASPSVAAGPSSAPILVASAIHECMLCAVQLAHNIFVFVNPSVLLLHVPREFLRRGTLVRDLNRAHPHTIINPALVPHKIHDRLFWIHLANVRFAMASLLWTNFTHILFLSSNELFIRPGVVDYIRRYDTVEMAPPDPSAGFLYEHYRMYENYGAYLFSEFKSVEELSIDWSKPFSFLPANGIVFDGQLRKVLMSRNLFKFPTQIIFNEGVFFSRFLAAQLVDAMKLLDYKTFRNAPGKYPLTEIYFASTLQDACRSLRCGHRVSTMVWGNTLDIKASTPKHYWMRVWTVKPRDIAKLLLSPFEVPFAVKRIPRLLRHPTRIIANSLTALEEQKGNDSCHDS